ncbi:hypothetical protein ACFL0P_06325 [Candidatus Omnitrophota bacterium]
MYKNLDIWLPGYIRQCSNRDDKKPGLRHIMFCVVDHFEPKWLNCSRGTSKKRVDTWVKRYPVLARRHEDSEGRFPQHTFFYPIEEYEPEYLDKISEVCKRGFGETEIHLHHDKDTPQGLREKIEKGKSDFKRHGLLASDKHTKDVKFGFVHGNWALDNSRKDGKWCGVNNELDVLKELGCYADFTLPSAPSDTQTQKINSIYYAKDDPEKPKSHNIGIDVEAGSKENGSLMIVQGPLALNWKRKKLGILPRIENSEITGVNPPTKDRVDLWIEQNISVKGQEGWIFVKVHTHGAQERNFNSLLGKPMHDMLDYLETKYNDGVYHKLHYVTAREMYNIIKAAEAGEEGNPGEYRDYKIK